MKTLLLGLVCERRLSSLARSSLFRWGPFGAIIAALERRRATVYPGWSAKSFALAARFCPRLIDRIIRRRMAVG